MTSIDEPVPFETQTVPSPLELPDYLFQTSRDNMVGAAGLKIKLVESRENLFHLLTEICSSDQDYGEDSDILESFQLQPYSMNNCLVTEIVLTVNSMEVFLKLLQDGVYRTLVANHWNNTLSILVTPPNPAPLDHQGGALAQAVLVKAVETEDALHWLSTLGGAYSNLGEGSLDRARQAGRNAMKQLAVLGKNGDVTVAMKCWLFIGQSLVQ